MQCPRHCIPTGDLECFEMFCTTDFLSGVLDGNQGEHTMQKVNKRQLFQNRLCPTLAILNRSRSETSSQVSHFTLGQMLLPAHWGWVFASAQFLCWVPNLACCLLWESQWELLVGSFLSSSFSDDTYSCPSFRVLPALFPLPVLNSAVQTASAKTWPRAPGFLLLLFQLGIHSLSDTPSFSNLEWSSTQSPAHSGIPKHAGLLPVNQKRSWCACELRRGQ